MAVAVEDVATARPATRRRARLLAVLSSGLLAAGVDIAAGLVRRTYPWGPISRSSGDLGQQYIPMYAHYRDILTGSAHGDLLFNWASAYGVPFLGDFMAYVGSTLSWLVVLFPRDRIDLAMYVIFLVAVGLAAGGMTAYLQVLRPSGPLWLAVLAGLSYGASAWPAEDGFMLVWLNGLVAFPILCLVGEWLLTRWSIVSMVLAPLIVTLLWTSHFYTVYMATIGAGIVTVARALSLRFAWRARLLGLLRGVVATAVGVGLAAPVLVPTFVALRASTPSPGVVFRPGRPRVLFARLLSGSAGVAGTPALAVGTVMLVLALTFAVNRRVPRRDRIVWATVLTLTALSTVVQLTHEVWHGFDAPNGIPYRQAFVLGGMIIIVGWQSAVAGVHARVLLFGGVVVAGLYLWTRDAPDVTSTTGWLVPAALSSLAGVGLALRRLRASPSRWMRGLALAAVYSVVGTELVASTVAVDAARAAVLNPARAWGPSLAKARELVTSADRWPQSRTTPGATATVNDPMLIGGEGSEYYSSSMPDLVTTSMTDLGWGFSAYGRALVDPNSPVTDALFGVGHRLVRARGSAGSAAHLELATVAAAPVVTVRQGAPVDTGNPGPFGAQETALGASLYDVPEVAVHAGSGTEITTGGSQGDIVATPSGTSGQPGELTLTATCTAGSTVYLSAPALVGEYRMGGTWIMALKRNATLPGAYTSLPLRRLGTVPSSGQVEVALRVTTPGRLPARSLGCLRPGAFAAALTSLRADAPTSVSFSGHALRATLPAGTRGTLVVATVGVPGWQCATGTETARPPDRLAGLIAFPLTGATSVTCQYSPPGLGLGLLGGAAALLSYLALLGWAWRHGTRTPSPDSEHR